MLNRISMVLLWLFVVMTYTVSSSCAAIVIAKKTGGHGGRPVHVTVADVSKYRGVRYVVTAVHRVPVEVRIGIGYEARGTFSTEWKSLERPPTIRGGVRCPKTATVRCSVAVYARSQSSRAGQITISLVGTRRRHDGPSLKAH